MSWRPTIGRIGIIGFVLFLGIPLLANSAHVLVSHVLVAALIGTGLIAAVQEVRALWAGRRQREEAADLVWGLLDAGKLTSKEAGVLLTYIRRIR